MRLIVIDLVPALLSWEGRGASRAADVAPEADSTLQDLYDHYRLAGIADGDRSTTELREVLAAHGLGDWFELVSSSAAFGPTVTPRVLRRLAAEAHVHWDGFAVVTAREPLAEQLRRSRIAVVLTGGPDEFWAVPDALHHLGAGHRP